MSHLVMLCLHEEREGTQTIRCFCWFTSSSKAPPPNHSTAFQNSTSSWGPYVQTHGTMVDVSAQTTTLDNPY